MSFQNAHSACPLKPDMVNMRLAHTNCLSSIKNVVVTIQGDGEERLTAIEYKLR